jgi:hypothetical protein
MKTPSLKSAARARAELWALAALMLLLTCGGFYFIFAGGLDHFTAVGLSVICFVLAWPAFNAWYARWVDQEDHCG